MKILMMGPQGSGKSTIGSMLSKRLGLPLIVVGDILRSLPKSHPSYEIVSSAMQSGSLVDTSVVAALLRERISEPDCASGYIMDGWGRRLEDLEAFNPGFDVVLNLDIPYDVSLKRISGRRLCTSNGKVYNIYTLPSELLSECTGELIQRPDDVEEAVRKRLDIYYSETQKVIDFFKESGILRVIDAQVPPDQVLKACLVALGRVA